MGCDSTVFRIRYEAGNGYGGVEIDRQRTLALDYLNCQSGLIWRQRLDTICARMEVGQKLKQTHVLQRKSREILKTIVLQWPIPWRSYGNFIRVANLERPQGFNLNWVSFFISLYSNILQAQIAPIQAEMRR